METTGLHDLTHTLLSAYSSILCSWEFGAHVPSASCLLMLLSSMLCDVGPQPRGSTQTNKIGRCVGEFLSFWLLCLSFMSFLDAQNGVNQDSISLCAK